MSEIDALSARLSQAERALPPRWRPAGAAPRRDDSTAPLPLLIRVSAAWPRGGHGSRGR
jgi:hypothetical protein